MLAGVIFCNLLKSSKLIGTLIACYHKMCELASRPDEKVPDFLLLKSLIYAIKPKCCIHLAANLDP